MAAAAAVTAALIVGVVQGPPTLTGRLITSWEPTRPLPGSAHAARAASGTWRLTSYLVARGWQENTAGPEPGWLTCPTAATCYVEGDNSASPSGPADMNSFYVSTGDGRLSAEELDDRLERALTARTYAELAALTADLPAAPGAAVAPPGAGAVSATPKDLVRIHVRGTELLRTGPNERLTLTAYGRLFARDVAPALESLTQSRSQATRHTP